MPVQYAALAGFWTIGLRIDRWTDDPCHKMKDYLKKFFVSISFCMSIVGYFILELFLRDNRETIKL